MSYDFDQYLGLREWFIYELDNQYSAITGINPFDPDGRISRMASRGDPKSKILEQLAENPLYIRYQRLLGFPSEVENPEESAALLLFAELIAALTDLEDPPVPIDVRLMAAEALESIYEGTRQVAQMIREGSSSREVFKALAEVPSWLDAENDYISRYEVSFADRHQIERWGNYVDLSKIILDIDLYE